MSKVALELPGGYLQSFFFLPHLSIHRLCLRKFIVLIIEYCSDPNGSLTLFAVYTLGSGFWNPSNPAFWNIRLQGFQVKNHEPAVENIRILGNLSIYIGYARCGSINHLWAGLVSLPCKGLTHECTFETNPFSKFASLPIKFKEDKSCKFCPLLWAGVMWGKLLRALRLRTRKLNLETAANNTI